MKEYKIITIDDLIDVYKKTNEDGKVLLMKDLYVFLQLQTKYKDTPLSKIYKLDKTFKWKNDGIVGLSKINIVKGDENEKV